MKAIAYLLIAAVVAGCSDKSPAAPPEPTGVRYTLTHVNDVPIAFLPTIEPGPWDEGGPIRLIGASLTLRSDRVYITSWTYRDLSGRGIHAYFSNGVFGKYTQSGNTLEFTEGEVPAAATTFGTITSTGLSWLRAGEVLTYVR